MMTGIYIGIDKQRMRLRAMVRRSTRGKPGYAIGYGLRVGYWPCLRAHWRIEIWYGLPSYRAAEGAR
jgi:hypothetical protein